jgi:hypothetical protein
MADKPMNMKTFRFKFSQPVTDELLAFSKLHQHDTRNEFKDAWKIWLIDNNSLVQNETNRLTTLGFNRNVTEKMYISARYYLRNKSQIYCKPVERKKYEGIYSPLLDIIDSQINMQISQNRSKSGVSLISPANAFSLFCEEYQTIIANAIRCDMKIEPNTNISRDTVSNYIIRLKKTYKNRFYIARTKCTKT